MTSLRTRLRNALDTFRTPEDELARLRADIKASDQSSQIRNQQQTIERLTTEHAASADEATEATGKLSVVEAQLRKVLHTGVDPYIRNTLFKIDGVAIGDALGGGDICFLGPNGCQTHPGWTLKGPNGPECGMAWVRSWLYDDDGKQSSSETRALLYVINDAESPEGLRNDALAVLRESLLRWLKETPMPALSGPDWGDREKRRLAEAMLATLPA